MLLVKDLIFMVGMVYLCVTDTDTKELISVIDNSKPGKYSFILNYHLNNLYIQFLYMSNY